MLRVVGLPGLGLANALVVGSAMEVAVLADAPRKRKRAALDLAKARVAVIQDLLNLCRGFSSGLVARDGRSRTIQAVSACVSVGSGAVGETSSAILENSSAVPSPES